MSAFDYTKKEKKYFESILNDLEKSVYADMPDEIKKFDIEKKAKFLGYLFDYAEEYGIEKRYKKNAVILIESILKSNLKLSDDDLMLFYTKLCSLQKVRNFYINVETLVLKQIEFMYKDKYLTETARDLLLKIKNTYHFYDKKIFMKVNERFDTLLTFKESLKGNVKAAKFLDEYEDRFSIYANDKIDALVYEKRVIWYKLIPEFKKCTQSKPTKKFNDLVFELIKEYGYKEFKDFSIDLISFINSIKVIKETKTLSYNSGIDYTCNLYTFISSVNTEAIKGLIWSLAFVLDSDIINVIVKLAEKSYEKIPGKGVLSVAIGNACLYTLTQAEGFEGVSALSRLRLRVKQKNTQAIIEKYLNEAAKIRNVTVEDLEDMSVPDFGLTVNKTFN